MVSQQNLWKHIRKWIEENKKINSPRGEILIDTRKPPRTGGNALVYDVCKSSFEGETVIKFLVESVSFRRSNRYKRFLDEFHNLINLVPTGVVVPLYQFGEQDMGGERIPYVVMERCLKSLDEEYNKSTKLANLIELKKLLDRLLETLEVVHTAGIVHRDLKPENILLRPNGTWVLGDFGISWFDPKFYTKLAKTEKSDRLANFSFSAPEQLRRENYERPTASMDLYALGQILYYCVAGHSIRGSGYAPFSQIAPELGNYDLLIERLVRQDPQERFQSVEEVRRFLGERLQTPESRLNPSEPARAKRVSAPPFKPFSPFTTLKGHPGSVSPAVAISPDGKTLVSGGGGKVIKVWSLPEGQLLRTLKARLEWPSLRSLLNNHTWVFECIAISPNGQTLAACGLDTTIKLWYLPTGQPLPSLTGHAAAAVSLAFSSDGKTLASGSWDHTVKIWNVSTGELLHTCKHAGEVTSVAISPDGKTLLSGSNHDKTIRMWDLSTGEHLHIITDRYRTNYLAISPDGLTLVSAPPSREIEVWYLPTGQLLRTFREHVGEVQSLALSPDGVIIAIGGDNVIRLLNVHTGHLLQMLEGFWQQADFGSGLAFSPDGQILVSTGRNKTIKIWLRQ